MHTLGARATGGRSHGTIAVHSVGSDEPGFTVDGLRVTDLARTLIDVARTTTFARAVGMIDHGLRPPRPGELRFGLEPTPPTAAELHELLDSLLPIAGSTKARKAIDFADARSGSLLESLSRVQLMLLGLPQPELQVPFFDSDGHIGTTDFYWRDLDLIGEADGAHKYDGENSPSGLPSPVVLKKEKDREDRLRRQVTGFVRWDWDTAYDRNRLAARVEPFGLRRP